MVYYFYILVCISGAAFVDNNNTNFRQQSKRNFAIIMGGIIFLLGALRHKYVGTDTPHYVGYLIPQAINQSYSQLFENARDPIFYMFAKSIYQITNDIQYILAVVAFLYALLVSATLYRFSKNIALTFLILLTFRYFPYSMTALRQAIAFAIVFYSTRFIFEKKYIQFAAAIIIASLAHKSALSLLPLYFVQFIPLNRNSLLLTIILLAATYVLKDSFVSILNILPDTSQYAGYIRWNKNQEDYGYLYYYLYIAVFIVVNFLLLYTEPFKLNEQKLRFYYFAFAIGIFFQTLTLQNAIFLRMQMYFAYYIVLLIPEVISAFDDSDKKVINVVLISLLIILFIIAGPGSGVDDYHFFWENVPPPKFLIY